MMADTGNKCIVFDTGPIISLAMNNLLWILKPLKEKFGGEFLIPTGVKTELIDKPFSSKKFKFESMQIMNLINEGIIKVISDNDILARSQYLENISNNSFYAKDHAIPIVHNAEMQAIALATKKEAVAIVIDERTTRILVENPKRLQRTMEDKLHEEIHLNEQNIEKMSKEFKNVKFIRSVELVIVAYELGLLDKYMINIPDSKRNLVDALMWAIKLNGCAVSEKEIRQITKMESK